MGITEAKKSKSKDIWVVRLDRRGNKVWEKTFGGPHDDSALSVLATQDGGYVIAGSTKSKGAGSSDAWVLKLDPEGRLK